jgi:stearoyl-CoA desaturase (delta-9 desaturase)
MNIIIKGIKKVINGNNAYTLFAFNILTFSTLIVGAFFINFSWPLFGLSFLMYWLTVACGISMCYHRLLTHKSYQIPKWLERVMATFGAISGTGGPIQWVMTHRDHHRYADKNGDPHPPSNIPKTVFGFYPRVSDYVNRRLAQDPYFVMWHRYYFALLASWAMFIFFAFGIQVFYFMYIVPVAGAILISNSQNYWGHVPSKIAPFLSYRSYEVGDKSQNNWIMAAMGFGEGYHNNHHRYPGSARFGIEKHEFDLSYYQIKFLEFIGLAKNIKTATAKLKV